MTPENKDIVPRHPFLRDNDLLTSPNNKIPALIVGTLPGSHPFFLIHPVQIAPIRAHHHRQTTDVNLAD
jgi:hypothetical protein